MPLHPSHEPLTCPICLQVFTAWENHHTWPKEYGGPEDEEHNPSNGQLILPVCGSDHNAIHICANQTWNGEPMTALVGDNLRRALPFIHRINERRAWYLGQAEPSVGIMFQIRLPPDLHRKIKKHKELLGRTSLEDYAIAVFTAATRNID